MVYRKYSIIAFLFIVLVVLVWLTNIHEYISLDQLKVYRTHLQDFVRDHYLLSVIIYGLLVMLATLFFIPVTVVLTIAAGFLFGVFPGTLYTVIGVTLGSVIVFTAVRYLLGAWVQRRYSREVVMFNRFVREEGAGYLLLLQLLPATPSFLINLLAGVTRVPIWTFIWTMLVGILPGTLIYTYAGKQLSTIEQVSDILSYQMLFLLVLLALVALLFLHIKHYRATEH